MLHPKTYIRIRGLLIFFNIFGSLAEFERELIKERTNARLSAARSRGRKGGRRPGLSKTFQQKAGSIKLAYDSKENSISEICENFSVSTATLYKCLRFVEERNQKKENKRTMLFQKNNGYCVNTFSGNFWSVMQADTLHISNGEIKSAVLPERVY